jgi:tetratricopeptide (TPR) repeat protein
MAAEAGFVAEDLMAREPVPANINRFRRALVMQQVPDPDAIIAALLSGSSTEPVETPATDDRPASAASVTAAAPAPHASHTIDIGSLLDAFESSDAASVELDLDAALDPADTPAAAPSSSAAPAAAAAIASDDIDDVFVQMRDEAGRRMTGDAADGEYQRALMLRDAGDIDGCIAALERASRTPRLRFVTAALLGRLLKARGEVDKALEWLEQAAQAPAPTPGDYHEVLYELADGLEASGETARALAVCLELQTDAGAYRDVSARVDRLARVQAER